MCMYVRTERPVSSGVVRHHKARPARNVQKLHEDARRTSSAIAAHKDDTFGFLNETFKELAVTDELMSGCYGLNIASSYDRLRTVSAVFVGYFDKPFDFEPPTNADTAQRLEALMEWFEKRVNEQGFQLATVKYDPYDWENGDIDFVVYNPIEELEMMVTGIIASPVETLPKKASELYARFLKFFSYSTTVSLGYNSDNYYLDMVIESYDDSEQDLEELDEEDRKYLEQRRTLVADYKTGKYKKMFEEIDRLDTNGLYEDIAAYIHECKEHDVRHLFEVLLEGMPIVGKMNIHWFDFNPEVDGITEAQDSFIEVFSQQMILYSFNDGIEEGVINALENDYNCGVIPVGYNQRLRLHESLDYNDIADFVDNRNLGHDFAKWSADYYHAVNKFDAIQEEDYRV